MADQHDVTMTLSGGDEAVSMIRELTNRCRRAGSVEDVERRIGRPLDEDLFSELFAISSKTAPIYRIEATPEFDRVMAALDG